MSNLSLPVGGTPELAPGGRRVLSDELLARLVAHGSERAFASLYERHHQAIYRYCRSILRNDHDAQEALQSTMMRAYAALGARDREPALKPWLFRIAHNEAISILRRRRPEEELSEEHGLSNLGVEGSLEAHERLSMLVADMKMLPERQRAALVMHELSGLSVREIGAALEMSTGAVKQALFEARSALHERSEGRDMQCESIRQTISSRDGRMLRGRRIRAHLEVCAECRRFRASMTTRKADLTAIAPPLPAAAASGLLGELLGHGTRHAAASAASTTLGGHAGASLLAKGITAAAVVAVAAGTVHYAVRSHNTGSGPSPSRDGRVTRETSSRAHAASLAHEIDLPPTGVGSRGSGSTGRPSMAHIHAHGVGVGAGAATPSASTGANRGRDEPGQRTSRDGAAPRKRASGSRGLAGRHTRTHAAAPRKGASHADRGSGGRAPDHSRHKAAHKREPTQTHGQPDHGQSSSHAPKQGRSTSSSTSVEGGPETGGASGAGHARRPEPAG